MKKGFLFTTLLIASMGLYAQYTQTLPLNYTDFFRAEAIAESGTELERGVYLENAAQGATNPFMGDQWNLTAKGDEDITKSYRARTNPAIEDNTLEWGNYIDNGKGKAIIYDGSVENTRVSIYSLQSNSTYSSNDGSKSYYLAALINFTTVSSTSGVDFLSFDGNYTANSQRARVYVKKGTNSSKFHIGLGYSGTPSTWSDELTGGGTHLIVVKITPNSNKGTNDESAEFFLDPNLSKTEAENVTDGKRIVSVVGNGIASVRGIDIVQRKNATGKVAGLRFSDNWADVAKAAPAVSPIAEADRIETDFNDGTWGTIATSPYSSGSYPYVTINGLELNAAGMQNGSKLHSESGNSFTNRISVDRVANGGMVTLPALSSISKFVLYVSAGSADKNIKLQQYDYDKGEWINVETWHLETTDCYRFERVFNSDEVTKLRIANDGSGTEYIWKIITYPIVTSDRVSTNFSDATVWGTPAASISSGSFPDSEVAGFVLTKAGLEDKSIMGPSGETFSPRMTIDKKSNGGMIILPEVTSAARIDIYASVGGSNPTFTLDAYNYNTDNWETLETYTIPETNVCFRFSYALNSDATTHLRIANADGSAKNIWKVVTYPVAPTNLDVPEVQAAAAISAHAFSARWNEVANASGYRIVVFNNDGSRKTTKIVEDGTINQYNITGLDTATVYTYKVAAYGDGETYIDSYLSDAMAVTTAAEITDTYYRTVTNGNFGTICLPKASADLSTAGAVFFEAAGKVMDGSQLQEVVLDEVISLEAGKPYIFLASADALNIPLTGDAEAAPNNSESNGLTGSFSVAKVSSSVYNFILSNNKLYCTKDQTYFVGENRAYINISGMSEFGGGAPAPGRKRVRMSADRYQTPTSLEDIQGDEVQCTKIIRDGRILIIRNGVLYDISGKVIQ